MRKRMSKLIQELSLEQSKIVFFTIIVFLLVCLYPLVVIRNYHISYAILGIAVIGYLAVIQRKRKELLKDEEVIRPKVRKLFFKTAEFVEVIPTERYNERVIRKVSKSIRYFAKEVGNKIIVVIKDEKGKDIGKPIEYESYLCFYSIFTLKN